MKVHREISKKRYFVAGIITILLFTTGLLLGMVFDYGRIQSLETAYQEYDLNYRSLQLQFNLLDTLDPTQGCLAFNTAISVAMKDLSQSLEDVETYKEVSNSQKTSFENIQRKYVLDNIRYWAVVKQAKKICDINKLNILYFYSLNDCSDCVDQGTILTYLKQKYGEAVLIFPINVDLLPIETTIEFLTTSYNVTTYPTIVVGDEVHTEIVSRENLEDLFCETVTGVCEE